MPTGWLADAKRASHRHCFRVSSSQRRPWAKILTATGLPVVNPAAARYTVPREPPPSRWTNRYRLAIARPTSGSETKSSRFDPSTARSEEHTSELQSPYDLVCRLLLE